MKKNNFPCLLFGVVLILAMVAGISFTVRKYEKKYTPAQQFVPGQISGVQDAEQVKKSGDFSPPDQKDNQSSTENGKFLR